MQTEKQLKLEMGIGRERYSIDGPCRNYAAFRMAYLDGHNDYYLVAMSNEVFRVKEINNECQRKMNEHIAKLQ